MPEALGVGDPCIVAIANGQLLLAGRVEAAKPIQQEEEKDAGEQEQQREQHGRAQVDLLVAAHLGESAAWPTVPRLDRHSFAQNGTGERARLAPGLAGRLLAPGWALGSRFEIL